MKCGLPGCPLDSCGPQGLHAVVRGRDLAPVHHGQSDTCLQCGNSLRSQHARYADMRFDPVRRRRRGHGTDDED